MSISQFLGRARQSATRENRGSVSHGEIRIHSGSGLSSLLLVSMSEPHHCKFLNDFRIMCVTEKSWSGWFVCLYVY